MSKKASAKRFRILDSKQLGQVTGGDSPTTTTTIDRGLPDGRALLVPLQVESTSSVTP